MRERLIELLKQADDNAVREIQIRRLEATERIAYGMVADYLLDNGVIVPPCAVGDTVYVKMLGGRLAKAEVRDFVHFLTHGFCLCLGSSEFPKQCIPFSEIGKTVFLTEEAEAKLRELNAHDREETVSELAELGGKYE